MMTNEHNTTLYTGVTSNLLNRVYEHKNKLNKKSFTARYNIVKLLYYEGFHSIEEAIIREKQLKAGSRKMKENLIKSPLRKDRFMKISFCPYPPAGGWLIFSDFPLGIQGKKSLKIL